MLMLEKFYPDAYAASAYELDYGKLYRAGYRAVGYDIDNTLVKHDAPANKAAVQLCDRVHNAGLKICFISNNHEQRVKPFAMATGADLYLCDAHKPSPRAYLQAAKLLCVKKEELLFIGDQLFTDIWGAKNAGLRSILVRPIGREKLLRIQLKRFLEYPILRAYLRQHKMGMSAVLERQSQ